MDLECIKFFLMMMGIGVILIFIFICLLFLKDLICDFIDDIKWKHKYKHRFDKPPLAKCYCKDCKYYDEYDGHCASHTGWKMADNWFCWDATPMKKDPEKEK
jgi:hypothetical protein